MSDARMTKTIRTVQNEVLRTRTLSVLQAVYPNWVLRPVLHDTLERAHVDASYRELDVQIHYLAEKELLKLEGIEHESLHWRAKLTARGIDFLEGRLEEIGLASPEFVG